MKASQTNIVPLKVHKRVPESRDRFRVQFFTNRGGSTSWRVAGTKRNGDRVRENFSDEQAARCRRIELEAEFHAGNSETTMRATKLSHEQIQLAEVVYSKLGENWPHLLEAVDQWFKRGKQVSVKDVPRIDDAKTQFSTWLETESGFRDRTQSNLETRLKVFVNSIPNLKVSDITPDTIDEYLINRTVANSTKDNDRRALSRFFSWCIYPKKWITSNPAKKQVRERAKPRETLPEVLTVDQCESLLKAAEAFKEGRLVPYVAVCLFGGLRPFEAARLKTEQPNLADREITLEPWQSKTATSRHIKICDTLAAWLEAYKDKEFFPPNWRKDFKAVREAAELKSWTEDVLRHTAISHFFRNCESYGRTAEQFGNSESIIKRHYQGRVSSNDTKKFYALRPGGAK